MSIQWTMNPCSKGETSRDMLYRVSSNSKAQAYRRSAKPGLRGQGGSSSQLGRLRERTFDEASSRSACEIRSFFEPSSPKSQIRDRLLPAGKDAKRTPSNPVSSRRFPKAHRDAANGLPSATLEGARSEVDRLPDDRASFEAVGWLGRGGYGVAWDGADAVGRVQSPTRAQPAAWSQHEWCRCRAQSSRTPLRGDGRDGRRGGLRGDDRGCPGRALRGPAQRLLPALRGQEALLPGGDRGPAGPGAASRFREARPGRFADRGPGAGQARLRGADRGPRDAARGGDDVLRRGLCRGARGGGASRPRDRRAWRSWPRACSRRWDARGCPRSWCGV